jgi:hypothetical protein
MSPRTPFLAEKCVELLQVAMAQLAVIQHTDPWHGVHARGEIDAAATVKYVYLFPTSGARLDLHLYPADTLSQARALYADPARVEQLLELRNGGWSLDPNFHFGFMTRGLTWTHTSLETDAYVAYWVERIACLGVFRRDDWPHTKSNSSATMQSSTSMTPTSSSATSRTPIAATPRRDPASTCAAAGPRLRVTTRLSGGATHGTPERPPRARGAPRVRRRQLSTSAGDERTIERKFDDRLVDGRPWDRA